MTTRIAQERATQRSAVAGATKGTTMAKTKKTYSAAEVDEAYGAAFIDGMAATYVLIDEVILKLQRSVEDVQAIYYIGDVVGKKAAQVAELQVALDTLTHLRDMVSEEYFSSLDEQNELAHLESIAALKDEWPL